MKTSKDNKKVIIIGENDGAPMAWGGEQLCYCDKEEWVGDKFPVIIYTKATAKKHIKNTLAFRKRHGYTRNNYILYPVK